MHTTTYIPGGKNKQTNKQNKKTVPRKLILISENYDINLKIAVRIAA